MLYRNSINRLFAGAAVGALVFGAGYHEAFADDAPAAPAAEEAPVNSGAVSFTLENDFTNAYFFRGILNERDGGIWEPSWSLGFKVWDDKDSVLTGATLAIGNWDSIHSKHTLHGGSGPKALYESDYYPSLTLTWAGGVTTGFTYYWYTSPNGGFTTTEEADLSLAFDDSPYLGAFALHPSAVFAFETKGGSFGDFFGINGKGHGKGDAALLSIAPSKTLTIPGCDSYPVTVALPVTLGLSMHNYYKDFKHNDAFGYASTGLTFSIPLAFMPKRYGAWTFTNGINVLYLSAALADVNHDGPGASPHGDSVYPVWMSSIIMSY